MPPDTREIEISEPEYTDLLNVSGTEKKRKLCVDIGGSNGSSSRVKKDTGMYMGFQVLIRMGKLST
jgi:23S rRNA pseudoU1915 N3-methylase RlmH